MKLPRSLMVGVQRTFTGWKKSSYLGEFIRLERFAEAGHVNAAVHDADHNVALGKCVPDVGEIGTATAAVLINEVTIQAAFRVKELCALEDRAACRASYFFRQRLRIEIWRPRRSRALNPECANHDHAEQDHSNRPRPP